MPVETQNDASQDVTEDTTEVIPAEGQEGEVDGATDKVLTFTQSDFDKQVQARVARAERKLKKDYADYETLKSFYAEHGTKKDEATAEVERQFAEREARFNARIVKSEGKAIAAELGAHNADVVLALIDLAGISVSTDGEVDTKSLQIELEDLKESNPYLFKTEDEKPRIPAAKEVGLGKVGARLTATGPVADLERSMRENGFK